MSELKLKKQAKKDNWLKTAGGDAGLQFLDSVVENLAKEAEDKMLEKEDQTTPEVEATTPVETAVEVTEPDTEVATEEVTKEAAKVEFVTVKELTEIVDTTIEVITAQTERLNALEATVKALTEKLEKAAAVVKEVNTEEIPSASVAAFYRQKALAALNSFDLGASAKVEATDELLKQKPAVKVQAEQISAHPFADFFSGQ